MSSLPTNDPKDIEQFVREQNASPFVPPFLIAELKTGLKNRFRAVYVLDTSKPAWCDATGVYRYGDGTLV